MEGNRLDTNLVFEDLGSHVVRQKMPLSVSSSWVQDELRKQQFIVKAGVDGKTETQEETCDASQQDVLKDNKLQASQIAAVVASIKTCTKQKDLCKGSRIHADIIKRRLLCKYVATALVNMYAKCGALAKAQETFDELPVRDVISWSALIAGHAQEGNCCEALDCFHQMQSDGIAPNEVTFISVLKVCSSLRAAKTGIEAHAEIVRQQLMKKNTRLGPALIDMYAKCGLLAKAQEVFDKLPSPNVISWNALLGGYAQYGHGMEALKYFEKMERASLSPDAITYNCILKACGDIGALGKGEEIHTRVVKENLLANNIHLGSALVDIYAKCGEFTKAQRVLDEIPNRNVVCWNAFIAGFVQHGHGHEALNCLERMEQDGLSPDATTFTCLLNACGSIGAIVMGEEIHVKVAKQGLLGKDTLLGTALVGMYAKCGLFAKAEEVFRELSARNLACWNALISGYAQHGQGGKALDCFELMQDDGVFPDSVTFTCILQACGSILDVLKGIVVHFEAVKQGLLEEDMVLSTALVDMYAKCGMLSKAHDLFEELPVQDAVSWSALIAGYAHHGLGERAYKCFEQMQCDGVSPDAVTFTYILKACSTIGAADKGKHIHAKVLKQGLLERNTMLGNALVDMYAKCGAVVRAQEMFANLPTRDIVSWSTLIAGYAQYGYGVEALNCFQQMQLGGFAPNVITYISILKACSSIGAYCRGKEVHSEIARMGLTKTTVFGNALVDMYAKSGVLRKAQQVFDELPVQNVVSWNALISGYGQHGHSAKVLHHFERMQYRGLSPDCITFAILLNTCSHTGLLDEGQIYYRSAGTFYSIIPALDHHTCMVDLFGRAGHLDNSMRMIEKLPPSQCRPLWVSVLGSCRKWGHVRLGWLAFEHVVQLEEPVAAAFICMSDIYVGAGLQETT